MKTMPPKVSLLPRPLTLEPPIARLMRGMVEAHLNDYLRVPKNRATSKHGQYRRTGATRYHDEAAWWFFNNDPSECDYVLSFRRICSYLGWSVEYVRRGIQVAHDRAAQGKEISVIIERAVL